MIKKINEFKTEEDILELLDDELAENCKRRLKEFDEVYKHMMFRLPVYDITNESKIQQSDIHKFVLNSADAISDYDYNNCYIDSLPMRLLYLIYQYSNHQIPLNVPDDILSRFIFRELFITTQGFAIVTEKWIKPLAEFLKGKKVVELFAGLGTITKALKDRGIDAIATDTNEWAKLGHAFTIDRTWCDIEELDAVQAIEKYKDADYFIISWCPYESKASYKALLKMREVNPNARLIHIGESYGGCTDNDLFFENAEYEVDNKEFKEIIDNFKSWDGIHDCITLCK